MSRETRKKSGSEMKRTVDVDWKEVTGEKKMKGVVAYE